MEKAVDVASSALLAAIYMTTNIWVWDRGQADMNTEILTTVVNESTPTNTNLYIQT